MTNSVPDPLLHLPDESISVPINSSGDEVLAAVVEQALDHINFHAMAWPAGDKGGNLVPPPAEHVLHELAHSYELASEEDLLVNPRLGTVAVVSDLYPCDLCGEPARYDAHVEVGDRSGGAWLCAPHYSKRGSGTLGAGGDCYLMLASEVPEWVQETCNQIRAAQGKAPLVF